MTIITRSTLGAAAVGAALFLSAARPAAAAQPFVLTKPASGDVIYKADNILINWTQGDPSSAKVSLFLLEVSPAGQALYGSACFPDGRGHPCLAGQIIMVPNSGSYNWPAGDQYDVRCGTPYTYQFFMFREGPAPVPVSMEHFYDTLGPVFNIRCGSRPHLGGASLANENLNPDVHFQTDSDTKPAACCSPDWNSVPSSSYNNPVVIAACSGTTQPQCVSNAAIHCLWNSQGPGCSGANTAACCTPQTPNSGVNCGDSSCNPPTPAAQANCLAAGNHAVQKGCNWNPECGGGASLGCCLQRDPGTGASSNCQGFPSGGSAASCKAPCQWNPLNDPKCGGGKPTGTLTVTKVVVTDLHNDTPPNPGFPITVTCSNGFSQTINLSGGTNQTISGLPAGSTCTVSETISQTAFMSFPRSCATTNSTNDPGNIFSSAQGPAVWAAPVYAPGQTVSIAAGANAAKITNYLHCAFGIIGNGKGSGHITAVDFGEAAKKTLQELADAYSAKSRAAFMRLVSDDFSGDLSTLEDAIVKDFHAYSSVNLSLLPDNVEVQDLSASVSFHYSLTGVSYQGVGNKLSGSSSFVFRREDGKVKLYKMKNPVIFGNPLPSPKNPAAAAQNPLSAGAGTAAGGQDAVQGSAEITAGTAGGAGGPGAPGSGFRFNTQSNVPESSADIYTLGGLIKTNAGSVIVSLGSCSLNSVTSAPGTITGTSAPVNRGECYAVKTAANKYAVLRVTSAGGALGGGSIGFDYKFQPGGSNSF